MGNINFQRILLLGILIIFFSCTEKETDLNVFLPEIEMISATPQFNGDIELKARFRDFGQDDLHYIGFCADSIRNPKIYTNQILVDEIVGNEFTAILPGNFVLASYDSLFVNAFAMNDYGYVTGTAIYAGEVNEAGVEVPCSLEVNQVQFTSSIGYENYISVSEVEQNFLGQKEFTATGPGNRRAIFRFHDLTTGEYTTSQNLSPDENNMEILIVNNGIATATTNGYPIYVNLIAENTYDITVCNLPWASSAFIFQSRVQVVVE